MQKTHLFLTVLIYLVLINPGKSQNTFSKIFDFGYPTNRFLDLTVANDTIVGYGLGGKLVDSVWLRGLLIAKMDSNGQVLKHTLITDSLGDYYGLSKYWGKIIATADGGYAMTAAPLIRNSGVLIKVNADLQIDFIKEYPDSVNLSNFWYNLLETKKGYLLYGAIQRPDYDIEGFLRLVDKQGNIIWHRYLDEGWYSTITLDVKKLNDSIFVSVSNTDYKEGETDNFTSFHYFDLEGNILDHRKSVKNPETGVVFEIVNPVRDSLIVFGLHLTDVYINTPLYKATLSQLNANHEPVWVNHFGPLKSVAASNTLHKFLKTSDGGYIGSGERTVSDGVNPTKRVGWLYKFDNIGDSLWARGIDPPFAPPFEYPKHGAFFGIGLLSSGNIIAGGSATDENDDDYAWIVKVSADGCVDTLFCQTTSTHLVLESSLSLFPNPATNWISINTPYESAYGRLELYHLNGQLCWVQSGFSNEKFNISEVQNGMYLCRFTDDKGKFFYGKVVVQK